MAKNIPDVRFTPDSETVSENLGLLSELGGTWHGEGFNLIARPDFQGDAPLYLQLNQTHETLAVEPIGSAIPNRGFGQDDIQLFGLTYLQKISDAATGGALHIEPGIWVTQQETAYPDELPPPGGRIIARMASIPHGNAVLAQGNATRFTGPPVLGTSGQPYAFSVFPSFNSTPFAVTAPPAQSPLPVQINAAGSSEKLTAAALTPPVPPFTEYDLTVAAGPANPRTPFGSSPPEPPLPDTIDGVKMQEVIDDPVLILQSIISQQVKDGYTFDGVALNIATQPAVNFLTQPNTPTGPSVSVPVTDGAGGIENILFLQGEPDPPSVGPNALTSLVYATFWIERVSHPRLASFLQLQYAQMTILEFGILGKPQAPILGWPHISVATLRKSFR